MPSRANRSKFYINDCKMWMLRWLEPLVFSLLQNQLFWESNNVTDINIFGFSHQILLLKLLANHSKDQEILIHLDLFYFNLIFFVGNACKMIW